MRALTVHLQKSARMRAVLVGHRAVGRERAPRTSVLVALTYLALLTLLAGPASAASKTDEIEVELPPEQKAQYDACQAQEKERAELAATGIQADMDKGPQWAKANLPAKRLKEILRFIHLDEQVRFRCGDVFATAQVAREEEAARIAADQRMAAQRALEALQAEMLKNIPAPVRKPPLRSAARAPLAGKGTPPLPVRSPL